MKAEELTSALTQRGFNATAEETADDPHAIAAQLERFLRPSANFRTSGG